VLSKLICLTWLPRMQALVAKSLLELRSARLIATDNLNQKLRWLDGSRHRRQSDVSAGTGPSQLEPELRLFVQPQPDEEPASLIA